MISLEFLDEFKNETLNKFYELTEGRIILGGSSVLKYHGIISRPVGNLNLVLNKSDIQYFDTINKSVKLTFVSEQNYGIKNKTYWFKTNNSKGVFFLSEDFEYDEFNSNGTVLRIAKIINVKFNKEELISNGDSNSLKHHKDVELINKFLGVELKRNII